MCSLCIYAQDDKTVTITVTGEGKTKEEAKQVALQNAIEQTFATFISSKKEILSNKVVRDEFLLESNGNIVSSDMISEIEIANVGFVTTLKTTLSITKLIDFTEKKGEIVEFKGGLFSQKIKMQKLNEDSETSVIRNLCLTSFGILKKSVDFQLKYSDPIVVGNLRDDYDESLSDYKFSANYGYYLKEYKPEDFIIKFTIDTKHNGNYFIFLNHFKKTIESLTMNIEEIEEYKNVNKDVYVLKIDDVFYYLRKKDNLENLYNLIIKSNIIPMSFKISSNTGEVLPLLKYRFSSKKQFKEGYHDFVDTDKKHSFINSTIGYNSDYNKTTHYDWSNEKSGWIFNTSNMYPYYKDFFKTEYLEDNYTRNDSRISAENKNKEPNNFLFIDTKAVNENSYSFDELFTLEEIEKIDNFRVSSLDIEDVLKNEEERLKNIKLVQLAGGGYEPYEDFYGRKLKDYMHLIGNGTIANLIEIQKDRVLVKVYKTKCGEYDYCDKGKPGKLFYIPLNKVVKYLKASEVKNEKGEISFKYN
jgi:hypothetical protein